MSDLGTGEELLKQKMDENADYKEINVKDINEIINDINPTNTKYKEYFIKNEEIFKERHPEEFKLITKDNNNNDNNDNNDNDNDKISLWNRDWLNDKINAIYDNKSSNNNKITLKKFYDRNSNSTSDQSSVKGPDVPVDNKEQNKNKKEDKKEISYNSLLNSLKRMLNDELKNKTGVNKLLNKLDNELDKNVILYKYDKNYEQIMEDIKNRRYKNIINILEPENLSKKMKADLLIWETEMEEKKNLSNRGFKMHELLYG